MPKINYSKLLEEKIREIIMTMRQIFNGIENKIYNSLTEEYEEEIIGLCRLIPSDWSQGVYSSFAVFMDVIDAIDWSKIATTINKYPKARIWFDVDVEALFKNFLVERTQYSDHVKSSVLQICEKFKPIFNGVNIMIKNPSPLLNRISLLKQISQENADILKELI